MRFPVSEFIYYTELFTCPSSTR